MRLGKADIADPGLERHPVLESPQLAEAVHSIDGWCQGRTCSSSRWYG